MDLFINAKLPTVIIKYPSGKYGIVGSIPIELTEEYVSGFTKGRRSKIWETEKEVINALISVGIKQFQLNNCFWYEERRK